jgi:FKBP-type peptidyl-prolyl cis-trans isomerase
MNFNRGNKLMRQKWTNGMAAPAFGLLIALAGLTMTIAPCMADDTTVLKDKTDRQSYSIGVELVRNHRLLKMDINNDLVIKGMRDAEAGGKLLLSDSDIASTMIEYRGEMVAKQRGARTVAGLDNKKKGDEFLAANKTKEGVVTLPSGLQYRVLKTGSGRAATDEDTVECNWKGTFINGTEFENTYKTGKPLVFKANHYGIVKGIRDALKLMPAGSKWELFVPPVLAYGHQGAGRIGPNETLIYELDFIAIK